MVFASICLLSLSFGATTSSRKHEIIDDPSVESYDTELIVRSDTRKTLATIFLVLEIVIAAFLVFSLVKCNKKKGAALVLNLVLVILFPIPYALFTIFFGDECMKSMTSPSY